MIGARRGRLGDSARSGWSTARRDAAGDTLESRSSSERDRGSPKSPDLVFTRNGASVRAIGGKMW